MSKYFSLKYLLISKKNGTLGYMVKKICFWGGPFGGVPGGVVPPNYRGGVLEDVLGLEDVLEDRF